MSRADPQLALSFLKRQKRRGGLDQQACEALLTRLRGDAHRVAEQFQLPPFDLDADRPDAHSRYGLCHADGRIRIRLVHARTGRELKYSAMIDTVIHELAHLRYMNHGPRWEALYQRMLAWARDQGIYEPREVSAPQAPPPHNTLQQLRLPLAPARNRLSPRNGT